MDEKRTDLELEAVHLRSRVAELEAVVEAQRAEIGKLRGGEERHTVRPLTAGEHRVLDMWPRFEDGEPVMVGDETRDVNVGRIVLTEQGIVLSDRTSVPEYGTYRPYGESFKRPAPEVLDADGVPIRVGDTVYESSGRRGVVTDVSPQYRCVDVRYGDCVAMGMDPLRLTHTRPDSWERLEEDARRQPFDYCMEDERLNARYKNGDSACQLFAFDIIRRAKALAGVE